MGKHRWSGWPGAICLKCGAEHALETAIAFGWYDPCTNIWDNQEHKKMVEDCDNNCPVMDDSNEIASRS